ncbi:MAG TPA: hypothetical protein ENH72_00380 [Pseudomonas sabulinigri]|uniref:Tyr recombinase domain-containing protein n=1 Tax=marine sediment metagenome TaxID=412755 RepID=A0A0F9YTA8_9ZZZZ|nr:hypothetical protein [Halopseudomonas sabulinigri]HEC51962.1 hypothetical protein [Halopseudomonas sabulinigri]
MLNPQKIKAMKTGDVLFEADPRNPGAGSLMFRRLKNSIAVSLRYNVDGKRQYQPIGHYALTDDSQGMTLKELREAHKELAVIREKQPDLKVYFDQLDFEKQRQERLAAIEASKGSFDDLLVAYIDERTRAGMSDNSIQDVIRFKRNDCDFHPALMTMRACDVEPSHINMILTPILQREKYRQAAKVRSYLHAAFAFGLKHDNITGRAVTGQTFGIKHNPVAATSFEDAHKKLATKAITRALNNAELAQFYKTCDAANSGISWPLAQLFKMVIASGGQRIDQLCRLPWSNVRGSYLHIIDSKGRGNIPRDHLVPHTERTRTIMVELEQITGDHSHPFSIKVDKPFSVASFSQAVTRWLQTDYAVIGTQKIPAFTPRDLRRTMTQLMKREGVQDSASNEIQSHGLTGVVVRHYNNDPKASLPSKQRTMDQVERILCRVLSEAPTENVISLRA